MKSIKEVNHQPPSVDSVDIAAGSLPALTAATPDATAAISRPTSSRRNFMKSMSLAAVAVCIPTLATAAPDAGDAMTHAADLAQEHVEASPLNNLIDRHRQAFAQIEAAGDEESEACAAEFRARLALVAYRPCDVHEADLKTAYIALSAPFTDKWCEEEAFVAAMVEELCRAA